MSAELFRLVLTEHELLTGEVNLTEFRRVLHDRFRVPSADVAWAEDQLRQHVIVPKPAESAQSAHVKLRDPDDVWVLASAIAGASDILVTGDKDLLSVADQAALAPLRIVAPRACWELLRRP